MKGGIITKVFVRVYNEDKKICNLLERIANRNEYINSGAIEFDLRHCRVAVYNGRLAACLAQDLNNEASAMLGYGAAVAEIGVEIIDTEDRKDG